MKFYKKEDPTKIVEITSEKVIVQKLHEVYASIDIISVSDKSVFRYSNNIYDANINIIAARLQP